MPQSPNSTAVLRNIFTLLAVILVFVILLATVLQVQENSRDAYNARLNDFHRASLNLGLRAVENVENMQEHFREQLLALGAVRRSPLGGIVYRENASNTLYSLEENIGEILRLQAQFQDPLLDNSTRRLESELAVFTEQVDRMNNHGLDPALVNTLGDNLVIALMQFRLLHENAYENLVRVLDEIRTRHFILLSLVLGLLSITVGFIALRLIGQIRESLRDQERSRQALAKSEKKYRGLLESSPDGVVVTDASGSIQTVNRTLEKLSGFSRAELASLSLQQLVEPPHPQMPLLQEQYALEPVMDPVRENPHLFLSRRDGGRCPVDISFGTLETDGGDEVIAEISDITEKLRARERQQQLELQLFRSQKMEAIGQLAGGIAHDFNNILTAMLGYAELAHEQCRGGDQPREFEDYLGHVLRSGEHGKQLVSQILLYSRSLPVKLVDQPLDPVINNTLQMLSPMMPDTIEIDYDFISPSPRVAVDAVQVEQIIVNLCINARDAMDGTGKIHISLTETRGAEGICSSCHQGFTGSFLTLSVEDNGPGVDPGIAERIFEPFFSTKETDRGTGMGLAMAHGIMHDFKGHILLRTAPGKGTTFDLLFPLGAPGRA